MVEGVTSLLYCLLRSCLLWLYLGISNPNHVDAAARKREENNRSEQYV